MRMLAIALVLQALAGAGVWAYSQGAPDTTCSSLEPGHRASKQTGPSPYSIAPGNAEVEPAKKMLVTLEAAQEPFMGFLVQARAADSQEVVGTFFTTDHAYLTCGKGFNVSASAGFSLGLSLNQDKPSRVRLSPTDIKLNELVRLSSWPD